MTKKKDAVLHPIIYVRGYAMTRSEIDNTSADPFCGFNLGSTVFRATTDRTKPPRKYIFESPLVRLASDFGYSDVFTNGHDIMDDDWSGKLPRTCIIIYRYYDPASTLLGTGVTPSIQTFARGLSKLIARVRDLVSDNPDNHLSKESFRCYLVAHSMGGLVCRAFLQNPELDPANTRQVVDKFFTYATPHNGIDMGGINVPSWLTSNDISNFNRQQMANYLNLSEEFQKTERVDWIPEAAFPSERIFCLVGTDRSDYEVAEGLSRTFVGHGSDGLVRIANASVCGLQSDGSKSRPTAKAFVYRSHSGYFGIVNSEESYQNLTRFLFGDLRVDIWLDVDDLRLPQEVQREEDAGKSVDALYQFEVLASPRGKLWYLTRRIAEEDSVACLRHQEWKTSAGKTSTLFLSTVFLDSDARVNPDLPSLAYSMTLGVRVPDYEIERRLWLDQHYEGGYLFQDQVVVEIFPPPLGHAGWAITYDWQSENQGKATKPLTVRHIGDEKYEAVIEFDNQKSPGIRAKVRFVASLWNGWA
jgi:hypothetical protein